MTVQQRDTGTCELLSTLDNGILTLTLNRPDVSKALSDSLLEALQREVCDAESNSDVRCVVVTGAGKAFCAGGDIKNVELAPQGDAEIEARTQWLRHVHRDTVGKLFQMPKPTLAVINGPAAGAGLSLALSCDLRVMSNTAFLLTAFATVALPGDLGTSYFLTQLLGSAKARQMMFLPDRISATEALALGLTNWCCEPDELTGEANQIARRLGALPLTALGYMKENLNRGMYTPLDAYLEVEASHQVRCMVASDHREGVAAFFEKRAPEFGKHR